MGPRCWKSLFLYAFKWRPKMGFKWRFRRARCWQGYGFGTTAAGDAGIAGRGTVLGPPRPETLAGVRFWDQHGRKRWQGHGHGDMVLHTHTHRRVARCFSIRRKYFRFAYGNACSLTNTHDCSLEPSFRSRRKPAQTGGCVCPCRGPCDTHQFALRA